MFGASSTTTKPARTQQSVASVKNQNALSDRTATTASSRSNESDVTRLPKIKTAPKPLSLLGSWLPSLLCSPSRDRDDPSLVGIEEDIECPPVRKEEEDPALAMVSQFNEKPAVPDDIKQENNNWGKRRRAITGTCAILNRKTRGLMGSCLVLCLYLIDSKGSASTNDRINKLAESQKENIKKQASDISYLNQWDDFVGSRVDEGNEEFENFLNQGLEDEKCETQLVASLHDDLLRQQNDHEALKNHTLATLTEQDEILKDIDENLDGTLNENINDLEAMKKELQDGQLQLQEAKQALLEKYTLLYNQAKYNIDIAEETLGEVQEKVNGALDRMETTRRRIDNQAGKGPVRRKILGKARDALNFVKDQLTSIGDTEFEFQELNTPEKYKEDLDRQFAPQEDLLTGLEDTANLIQANCVDGIVTHEALSQAHQKSSSELRTFIEEQDTLDNLLKTSENFLELYDTKSGLAKGYVNSTKNTVLDPNKTHVQLDDIPEEVNKQVDELFDETILSDEAKQKFDTFDNAMNGMFWGLVGVVVGLGAYAGIAVGRRTFDEMTNNPNGSPGERIFNQRYDKDDGAGTKFSAVEAAKKTGIKKKGMRCERFWSTARRVVWNKKNPLWSLALAGYAIAVAKKLYLDSSYNELSNQALDRVNGVNTTLADARKEYESRMTDVCQERYKQKLSVIDMQAEIHGGLEQKSEADPKFNETLTFYREHQPEECRNSTLNKALQFKDMTAEEILNSCEQSASKYADEYENTFDHDQYIAESMALIESLKNSESSYRAKESFGHWAMVTLIVCTILSESKLGSTPYENPDEHEEKDMGAKRRGWFANREKKGIPKELAEMHHLLNYLNIEIGGKPLLTMDDSWDHMKGYNPKHDKNFEGELVHYDSAKAKNGWCSWLPEKKGLKKKDQENIDKILNLIVDQLDGLDGLDGYDKEKLHYILEREVIVIDVKEFQEKTAEQGWLNKAIGKAKESMPFINIEEPESKVETSERSIVSSELGDHSEAEENGVEALLYRSPKYNSDYGKRSNV